MAAIGGGKVHDRGHPGSAIRHCRSFRNSALQQDRTNCWALRRGFVRHDGFRSSDQRHMLLGIPNGLKAKMGVSDIAVNEVSSPSMETCSTRWVRWTCFAV